LGGISDIDACLSDEAVSDRLTMLEEFGLDEATVARKLHEFHKTRGDFAARRALLRNTMAAHDVSTFGYLGTTTGLVNRFLEGSIDVDVDEVVGIAKISLHLNKIGGYHTYLSEHKAVEKKFKTFLHFECLGLKDSYEKSIKGVRRTH